MIIRSTINERSFTTSERVVFDPDVRVMCIQERQCGTIVYLDCAFDHMLASDGDRRIFSL